MDGSGLFLTRYPLITATQEIERAIISVSSRPKVSRVLYLPFPDTTIKKYHFDADYGHVWFLSPFYLCIRLFDGM